MKIWLAVIALFLLSAQTAAAQNAAAGKAYFERNCSVCHSADKAGSAGQGPPLFGIVGRRVGTMGFGYSNTLMAAGQSGKTWTAAALDAFLANPSAAMPGTAMPVSIAAAKDRANVIAYLKTLVGGRPRKLSDFPDMTPGDVAAAQKSAKAAGFDVWTEALPGTMHHITVAQMPRPLASKNVSNPAKIAPRPANALPKVPAGFTVSVFSQDVDHPRNMAVAPNGDIFVAESAANRIKVIHPGGGSATIYASGLDGPFGMAFYPAGPNPKYLYVANTLSIVRFAYKAGDTKAPPPETIVSHLTAFPGGHITRTLVFTADGQHMLVSVGAATNVANPMPKKPPQAIATWEAAHGTGAAWADEFERAAILQFDPDGKNRKVYAQGIRNCVGMAIQPQTGGLLCSNNERDYIGDDLPPDFFTRVPQGSFFGWPWYYIGAHQDPRHAGERPDLKTKITVPDLLIQPHSAPLGFALYYPRAGASHAFPAQYTGDAFIALHGSGNRTLRTGEKIVRVKIVNGAPADSYQDFMTGFIVDNNSVWGKPVAVVVAADGALLVSDDVSNTIWRIAPGG